jgi:hypothetical protein
MKPSKGTGDNVGDADKGKGWSKRDRKVNATVATDVSTLTSLNASIDQPRSKPCSECRLYLHPGTTECPIWDRDKRIFNVKNFVRYKQVVKIHADGNRSLTPFWKGKLISFGFPGMNIHKETDQKKIFDDINSEIKKMPVATVEERRQYAERAKGLTNLATTTEEVDSVMTNNTNVSASGDDGGKRKKKSKSKKSKKRDESSDDSESGYDSDGSASP